VDRFFRTQFRELGHRQAREVDVRVEEVEVSWDIGGWHAGALLNCNVF
jgi:hypothetical protein